LAWYYQRPRRPGCRYLSATERYRSNVEKQYAAKRDFNHLKVANQDLVKNIATLCQMYDERLDRMEDLSAERSHQNDVKLTEMKMLLVAVLARIGGDSSQFLNGPQPKN